MSRAQEQQPAPPLPTDPTQNVLKIPIEEVRIPVFAFDDRARFDPTLSIYDLMVREDGVAQKVRGVYRVPAYVLVFADTGGEVNPAKTVRLTAEVAKGLVSDLRPDDWIGLMQVNTKVELLSGWSKDHAAVIKALETHLLPGKRSAIGKGLARAVEYFQNTPAGNRHLVIISDGYEATGEHSDWKQMTKSFSELGIAVHVISYTSLGRKVPPQPLTYAKAKSNLPEEQIMSLPVNNQMSPDLREIARARGAYAVDLDRLMHGRGNLKKELAERESELRELAEETGGHAWLPADAHEMIEQSAEAARDIDSQYVVTYEPLRRLTDAKVGEYRKLDVISRRVGLSVRSRRGYVVQATVP